MGGVRRAEARSRVGLIAEGLLLAVDPQQHGLLCVVALHLHHNVVLGGTLFGAGTQNPKVTHTHTHTHS